MIRRVSGDSMLPAYAAGRLVIGWRWFRRGRLRTGQVVIIRHDGLEKIKRIAAINDDSLYVLGDNPAASTDSRHFGPLKPVDVMARVIWPRQAAISRPSSRRCT